MSSSQEQPAGDSPDGFPLDRTAKSFPWQVLANEFLNELPKPFLASQIKPSDYASAAKILKVPPVDQAAAYVAIMERRTWHEKAFEKSGSRSAHVRECRDVLVKLARALARRELPFTAEQAETLVAATAEVTALGWNAYIDDLPAVLKICEVLKAKGAMSPGLYRALEQLKAALTPGQDGWESAASRRAKESITRLLAGDQPAAAAAPAPVVAPPVPKPAADAKSRAKEKALIHAHLRETEGAYPQALKHTKAGREILAADADQRASIAARALELWPESDGDAFARVASELLRLSGNDWTPARLVRVVEAAAVIRRDHEAFGGFDRFPHKPLISAVEKAVGREKLSPELRLALMQWKDAVSPRELTPSEERQLGEAETIIDDDSDTRPWSESSEAFETFERLQRIRTPLKDERKLIERLAVLLGGEGGPGEKQAAVRVDASDAVGKLMAADVAAGQRASGPAWATLLTHARSLSATRPSSKWSSDAAEFAAKIEPEKFGACVSDWLNEAGKPGPKTLTINHVSNNTLLNDCSVDLLKGLAWTIVAAKRADLAPALGNLAEACFKKIPDRGPRNVKVANAATAALAALADPAAATQLSRLRLRVKHPSSRSVVDKALNAASENTGLSPDDLAEMSVPAFGLDRKGARRIEFGDTYAEVRVANAREVELNWFTRGGKACASVPAIIRTKHADELKRLNREVKDASIMLVAQALRLERSFMSERNWPIKVWRERFLEHPLLGTLTRRLIWQFDDRLAVPHGKELLNVTDRAITPKDSAAVSLWHPMRSTPDDVLAWRNWLERHEITQPFKQAHREIYVLTDAERRTDTYSNRFAAHILRQHQLAALCQSRGWNYRVQGQFDSHNVPTLALPAQNLTAEFRVDAVELHPTPRGIYPYAASDHVRFGRPLKDVPPVIFSEVMRDVDLFVGVASVASDPTWQDGGPDGRYREYWNRWSFGDLSESARNRKTILERLVPRLADAKRFRLIDRFLLVRGQLRTYKIHIGSGNILMEPNDQYLCIVADRARKPANTTWLPFEGDGTLSLILSKALMLAADDQITDQTITRQIKS